MLLTMTMPELDNGQHESTQHEQGVLTVRIAKIGPEETISNWRSGIVKDTGLVIRDLVQLLRISRLPLTLDLVLASPAEVVQRFPNSILIQSLIFTALDFMSSISETENPSTQTFKYISLHSPRHSMLRDNRRQRDTRSWGILLGFNFVLLWLILR